MRILFVNEHCGYFGGVEQNIADTTAALRGRGHECTLAYGVATDRGQEAFCAEFTGCFSCAELRPPGQDSPAQPFSEILEVVKPDIIYIHKAQDLGFCESLPKGIRTVRMVHDHDLCCPRRHKYHALTGRVCTQKAGWGCMLDGAFLARDETSKLGVKLVDIRRTFSEMKRSKGLDALIVASGYMREELLMNDFAPEKVHIVPPLTRLADPDSSPVPTDPEILYVGQLVRGKGVDLLLQALRKLPCGFNATIVGAGNAQTNLVNLTRYLGLSERVHFHGWADHDEIDRFYARAKVVVVPSRWPEPFGMVGIEAMSHGRPVVAFDSGGISDWLEDGVTGILVQERDTAGLAKAIERVLTDTAFAGELGRNAKQRVKEHFSFEDYIDHLETVLQGRPTKRNSIIRERREAAV